MHPLRASCAALAILSAAGCATQQPFEARRSHGAPGATSVQALIGAALYDDGLRFERSDPEDPSNTVVADLSQMPLLGIAGQLRLTGDQTLEAGIDGALIFSWWSDSSSTVSTGSGTAVISISRQLLMTDVSLGAFVATVLGGWLRLYAGAGPLMVFAAADFEDESSSSDENGFGIGGYLRAGAEFRVDEGSYLGFGARAVSSRIDFGGEIEDLDADGVQLMMTFTKSW